MGSKIRFTVGLYQGKWAVFMEPSMTWLFTQGGLRGAQKRVRELQNDFQ